MNSVLQELGYTPEDRVLIVHADDIGMCHASLSGLPELFGAGIVTSAAVMVPCPWFLETAAICRQYPELDLGVHLTTTAEWERFRWRPVTTRDHASGMLDAQGYFYRTTADFQQAADIQAVEREISAQVELALREGIDVTHIDSHMGSLFHPRFITSYAELAMKHRIPAMLFSEATALVLNSQGFGGISDPAALRALLLNLEAQHYPLFDSLYMLPLNNPSADEQFAMATSIIDQLPAGLSIMIAHPAQDTPELRAIAGDWQSRVANYQVLTDPRLREYIEQAGVHLVGYRVLRDLIRKA